MKRDVFHAIADPTRRSILLSLTTESQNVNTLADRFDMSRQAVSLHIKYLHECGVISIKKEGRERYCTLEAQKLTEVADWLEPFRQMWLGKLNQLDKLLEELQSEPKQDDRTQCA
ncbi:MAG: metalloregulator ArsR/SmtB family transcription factor [Bacteroidota bacterium]